MIDQDSILSKIRKLLALSSESSNDSDNERATALRQANALMDKHGVEIADLDSDELGDRGESGMHIGSIIWKARVVASVARLYGCGAYRTQGGSGQVFVVGRSHYRKIVLDMGQYIIDSILREAKAYKGRTLKNSFGRGAAYGIHTTVKDIQAQRKEGKTVQETLGTAMVLVDHYESERALNTQWLNNQDFRLHKDKQAGSLDRDAFKQGQVFGNSVNLSDQIGGRKQPAPALRQTNG